MPVQPFTCLWFNHNAKEAADFYCSIFNNSCILHDSPMVVNFEIEGRKIMGLNGGPHFKINPSISLFVCCINVAETDRIWNSLMDGGHAIMQLDKYAWSERYGWVEDKYGMTWQIMLDEQQLHGAKIIPSFLFVNEPCGRAQQAITHYCSIFADSQVHHTEYYKAGGPLPEGHLMFGRFSLGQAMFVAMDGPGEHGFQFNEGVSLVVQCDTQDEIDYYWNKLTEGGSEVQCGWLRDAYGVSWQVVPTIIGQLMNDPEKSKRVMAAVMTMKKLDIEAMMNA
jgi:predicted 3-demethylubiquinone-9 3-methyltransferase (glyoxalase superfamily)